MLRVFGTPHIEGDRGGKLPSKAFALVAMLRLDFQNVADRAVIAERLWEGTSSAGASLRMLLSNVRRWEEATRTRLVMSNATKIWRDDECLAMDLDRFAAVVDSGSACDASELLKLYTGEFLLGVDFPNGPELSTWIGIQRDALRRQLVGAGLRAAANSAAAESERLLRLLSGEVPHDETVERALLDHLGTYQGAAAVQAEYGRFRERLDSEIGIAPSLETRAVVAQLVPGEPEMQGHADPVLPGLEAITPTVVPQAPGLPRVLLLPPEPGPHRFPRAIQLLAQSLIDDVTYSLGRLRSFAVIAPHTARQISQGASHARVSIGADYVMSTRLLPGRSESSARLGLSLTREATNEVLLGDALPFSQQDLPSRHADLADAIVGRISHSIERAEVSTYRRTGAASAYVHYLIGQERLRVVELPDLRKARQAFRRASTLMPEFAPALSAEARTFNLEWVVLGRSDREPLDKAREIAQRAVDIDPLEASGHRELGHALLYMHDLDQSLYHLEAARSRAPHHADIVMNVADVMIHNSMLAEARPLVELGKSLNPLPPDEYHWIDASLSFLERRPVEALNAIGKMKNPDPVMRLAAASAAMAGDMQAAQQYRNRIMARQPDFRLADWRAIMPLKNPEHREYFIEALRLAGFA